MAMKSGKMINLADSFQHDPSCTVNPHKYHSDYKPQPYQQKQAGQIWNTQKIINQFIIN